MAWSTPRTWVAGELVTAAVMNSAVRDELNILKTPISDVGNVVGPLQGYNETLQSTTISAGVVSVDVSLGNHVAVPLNAAITSFTFTNLPASGKACSVVIYFTADGTLRAITHTINTHAAKFPGNVAPTMTSTNGKIDKIVYTTTDGGATFMAEVMAQNE